MRKLEVRLHLLWTEGIDFGAQMPAGSRLPQKRRHGAGASNMRETLPGAQTLVVVMRNGAQHWDDFIRGKLLIGGFDWRRPDSRCWGGEAVDVGHRFKVQQFTDDWLKVSVYGCDWMLTDDGKLCLWLRGNVQGASFTVTSHVKRPFVTLFFLYSSKIIILLLKLPSNMSVTLFVLFSVNN